jgi:hypothetical protein
MCPLLPNFRMVPGAMFQVLLMRVSLEINRSCEKMVLDGNRMNMVKRTVMGLISYKLP